jgi:hypothetical protein
MLKKLVNTYKLAVSSQLVGREFECGALLRHCSEYHLPIRPKKRCCVFQSHSTCERNQRIG